MDSIRQYAFISTLISLIGVLTLGTGCQLKVDINGTTVVITSPAPLYSRLNPVPFTLEFNQPVDNLSSNELVVSPNGRVLDVQKQSPTVYTVEVEPLTDGLLSLTVSSTIARDDASPKIDPSGHFGRYYDSLGPVTPTILTLGDVPNSLDFSPTLFFVSGVDTMSGWESDQVQLRRWSDNAIIADWTIFQSGDRLSGLSLSSGQKYFYLLRSVDKVGNPGPETASVGWTAKQESVVPTLASTTSSPTNAALLSVTLSFNYPIESLNLSDLTFINGTAENMRGSDKEYQFDVRPVSEGPVKIILEENKVRDNWNNQNVSSNELTLIYDTTPPTVAFSNAPSGSTGISSASITVTDSLPDAPTGLNQYRFKFTEDSGNCASADGYSASPTDKTTPIELDLRRMGNGPVTLCAVGIDHAGNWQTFANATSATWTLTGRPTAILTGSPDAIDSRSTLGITVGGNSVSSYQYKLGEASVVNCVDPQGYGSESNTITPITNDLSSYLDGTTLKICVIGGISGGIYQSFSQATEYSWLKDTLVQANISFLGESYNDSTNQDLTFNITLDQPKPYDVTISFTPYGTASLNQDFSLLPQNVVIPANSSSALINYSLLRNSAVNGEKTLNFRLSGSSRPGVTLGAFAYQFNTIKDSDSPNIDPVDISASSGGNHTCIIRTDGKIFCWGANMYGQIGNGGTDFVATPITIDSGVSYRQISTGRTHTCGLTTDYKIRCWGDNTYGQIGNGAIGSNVLTPEPIDSGNSYSQVYAGLLRTCALRKDSGEAYCWGQNNFGQIGDGTSTQRNLPTPVSGGGSFKQIAAGGDASCGILADDTLRCWGGNAYGQVGDGTTTSTSTPKPIDSPTTYKFVGTSFYHTCGITSTDQLKCWGYNSSGQLGNGTTTNNSSPVAIDPTTNYTQVILGGYSTCGITTTGALKCWGNNETGQLGNGSAARTTTPDIIDPGTTYLRAAAGFGHTCGITNKGTVKCWGDNSLGLLGDGMSNTKTSPSTMNNLDSFIDFAIGYNHTCGLLPSGKLKCWGLNGYGQLGDGTTRNSGVPLSIDTGTNYKQVVAGRYHSCALNSYGTVKCWGQNLYGQLGDGTNTNRLLPQVVDPSTTYLQLGSGDYTVCGLTSSKQIKCWGLNNRGTVGDTTTTSRNTPTIIDSATSYEKITVSSQHACGLTSGKQIKCWGYNSFGQVGDGTTTHRSIPTSIADPGTLYDDVIAGSTGVCGYTDAGVIKCWGHNGYGQLLDGTTINRSTPLVLNSGLNFKTISLAGYTLCGISETNALFCWGENFYGTAANGSTSRSSPLTAIDVGTSYAKLYSGIWRFLSRTSDGQYKNWGSYEYFQESITQWIPPWLPHPIPNIGE